MLTISCPLSLYDMVSAVQPQAASIGINRLNPLCHQAAGPHQNSGLVLARLNINSRPEESLLVNPVNAVVHPYGEGSPFIIGGNVHQQTDGLAAVIVGEPGIINPSNKGTVERIDARDLLELYKTLEHDCVTKLRGSWAMVIVDPDRDRVLLASDRMGRQPLYFRIGRDSVLIGNEMDSLRTLSGEAGLDSQSLYHYLYFHMVPAPGAVVERFHKLGPALMLELTSDGHNLTRYWTPTFNEKAVGPVTNAHAELKDRMRTAVQRCSTEHEPDQDNVDKGKVAGKVGAFLSGGLDSSTVAGMLSELQGGSCDAYSIGFDAEGYDEMPYARAVASHFGIRLHEHYVTPDEVVQALPEIAASFDEPFGNSSVLPAYFCARMAAEDGVSVLLAGDGGDELFAGNTRYAGQTIFEGYRRTPRWLRSGVIEPLLAGLPEGLPLVTKGKSFLRQANTPLPERLQYYSFLEKNSPDDVFTPQFMKHVDRTRPLEILNSIYQLPGDASVLNRMLFLDWQITLADNDLRKVTRACELAGVKVRYPMLDEDLVELSTSIPSSWKMPGNKSKSRKLRNFYKQAFSGWLPDVTINKSKHGFGLPFGVWMKNHKPLQELAFDTIMKLKTRRIFLPEFLDQAIANHRQGHAAYYGELVWVLTCLELWLAAHQPDYVIEHQ